MPLLLGCLALGAPRLVLVLVWIFSDYVGKAYSSNVWPLLGFFLAPLTTLAYAWAKNSSGGELGGFHIAIVVVAVLIDLGLLGGGARSRFRKKD